MDNSGLDLDENVVWYELGKGGSYRGDMLCQHLKGPDRVLFYRGYTGMDDGGHPRWIYSCDQCWMRTSEEFRNYTSTYFEPDEMKKFRLRIWEGVIALPNS